MATQVRRKKRETPAEPFTDRVKRLMEERGWNAVQLAERSELSKGTVLKVVYGERPNPTLHTIRGLAWGLGVSYRELIDGPTDRACAAP